MEINVYVINKKSLNEQVVEAEKRIILKQNQLKYLLTKLSSTKRGYKLSSVCPLSSKLEETDRTHVHPQSPLGYSHRVY